MSYALTGVSVVMWKALPRPVSLMAALWAIAGVIGHSSDCMPFFTPGTCDRKITATPPRGMPAAGTGGHEEVGPDAGIRPNFVTSYWAPAYATETTAGRVHAFAKNAA